MTLQARVEKMRTLSGLALLGLSTATAVHAGTPSYGGESLDSKTKGFRTDNRIPREPLEFVCDDCNNCNAVDQVSVGVSAEASLHECEQACYFEAECHYISYNKKTKECQIFHHCTEDRSSDEDWTRLHKKGKF